MPQGVKTNLTAMKMNNNFPSTSSSSYQSHQTSFTSNNSSTQPQSSSVSNPNTSIDSITSQRQQMQVPSFLNNQKMPANQGTKIGYSGQTVPMGAPVKTTAPLNYPAQQGLVQNPGIWRKN